MLRKIAFITFLSVIALSANAQNPTATPPPQDIGGQDDVMLLYRNEINFGAVIHSNGFGFNFRKGKHVTGYLKRVLEIEAVSLRHPKETRTQNPLFENSKGYFYGKQFSVIVLRTGYGFQRILYGKQDRRGVEIRMVTFVGASIALAKPVYLDILNEIDPQKYIITTEKYDPTKHFSDNIYGRAPYFKGFDEMKFFPGGYAKLGFTFEYANLDDDVKAIETGVAVDIYPKVIPIMATAKNNQVYVNLYINFLWGKKWF